MARYKLTLEYDGTGLAGWQRQANGVSMQGLIEAAIFEFRGERVAVHGAGRTDAGVHALGQVAHFDLERAAEPETVMGALNHHLKANPVAVLACARVADDFHARFSATRRHYLYRIINRRAPLTLEHGRAWQLAQPIDADQMAAAAALLVGSHDFTSFRAAECQAKSPVKTLDRLDVARRGSVVEIVATARSFLHHQVRAMVGTLALVGTGKWRAANVAAALAARDRTAAGPTAPAAGLYLTAVDYD